MPHPSAALDVTITSSLQPNTIKNAAEMSSYQIDAAEDQLFRVHEQKRSQQDITIVLLAVEVLRGKSSFFKKTLQLITSLSDSSGYELEGYSIALDSLAQSLSVVLIRR